MNIQKMSCPSCGAPISVAEDLNQLKCAFCGSILSVQRGEGPAALKTAEKLGQPIQAPSARTQGATHEGTQVTQLELKQLQIKQDITAAQLQLWNVQAEIRSLEREKATGKTRQRLRELRHQEAVIRSHIAMLQAALPDAATHVVGTALAPMTAIPERKPWYRSFGWMALLFFFLTPVWAVVILWDKKQSILAKVVAGIILSIFLIAYIASRFSQ
ncbi:MAG: hypothetical protein H5T69_10285 [Chloroflexi bacterium]|nr:hypothetical protein [Chloroflexota bacterium]